MTAHGKEILVDEADLPLVKQYQWNTYPTHSHKYYARTGKYPTLTMHRLIMNAPDGLEVDHINGNGLDNRRANLRLATSSQNRYNTPPITGKRFKGVTINKNGFVSTITVNRKRIYLGYFRSEQEAAKAYNAAAKYYLGEFARLNMLD